MTLESDHMSVHWTMCRVTSETRAMTLESVGFRTLTVHLVMWPFCCLLSVGCLFALLQCSFGCVKARSGSKCEVPLLAVAQACLALELQF